MSRQKLMPNGIPSPVLATTVGPLVARFCCLGLTPTHPQDRKPENAAPPGLTTALRLVGCCEADWEPGPGERNAAGAFFSTIACGRAACSGWCSTKSACDWHLSVSAATTLMPAPLERIMLP